MCVCVADIGLGVGSAMDTKYFELLRCRIFYGDGADSVDRKVRNACKIIVGKPCDCGVNSIKTGI